MTTPGPLTLPIELDPEEKGNSMSRPNDIPQDVWEAAEMPAWLAVHSNLPMQVEVARAIMAERERCAKIADAHAAENWGMTEEEHAAQVIAAAIRSTP